MISGINSSKMATKNCPKCDNPNPVACKKCACGHVFFTTRRSANAIAVDCDDISEPTTPQEPEIPRRRTARVTRERPQFYDALQVENQTRRQKELQKRRKASKSEDVEASSEEIPTEKVAPATTTKRRAESPPAKAVEPPRKKRRGRPPGLTNRKTGRAQILASKTNDAKVAEGVDTLGEDELELVSNLHQIPAAKALQMNMVLSDINSRISSSSVRAEISLPKTLPQEEPAEQTQTKVANKDKLIENELVKDSQEVGPKNELVSETSVDQDKEIIAENKGKIEDADLEESKKDVKIEDIKKKEVLVSEPTVDGKTEVPALSDVLEKEIKIEPKIEVAPSSETSQDQVDAGGNAGAPAEQNGEANIPVEADEVTAHSAHHPFEWSYIN